MQKQTELTANELVSRPTYVEEFQNIRENVHKVVLSTLPEDWADETSKYKFHRSKTSMHGAGSSEISDTD